jgi:hypothetical protein
MLPEPLPEPLPGPLPEPWLRGILPEVDPVIGHLLRASQHIREDAGRVLTSISGEELWATRAGFHAKHLAGSTERLCTYLAGGQLTEDQGATVSKETVGSETAAELMALIGAALDRYEKIIRKLDASDFSTLREIGRKRLPVTAISLAIHITEHGMRHVGQLISTVGSETGSAMRLI